MHVRPGAFILEQNDSMLLGKRAERRVVREWANSPDSLDSTLLDDVRQELPRVVVEPHGDARNRAKVDGTPVEMRGAFHVRPRRNARHVAFAHTESRSRGQQLRGGGMRLEFRVYPGNRGGRALAWLPPLTAACKIFPRSSSESFAYAGSWAFICSSIALTRWPGVAFAYFLDFDASA